MRALDVLNNNLWKVIVVLLTSVVCSLSKTAPPPPPLSPASLVIKIRFLAFGTR